MVRKPSANRNHVLEAAAPEISCHKRRARGTVAARNGLVRQLDHELKQIYALRYGIDRDATWFLLTVSIR